eukprot:CAMPEP_0171184308 /NCGR_PEP_ID=MMETSP0790-20130122/15723_1 /TAXON_ID=2925 /ORGANISM="Alexandrium catenella, Strain OF101" /LENGTH=1834 /DNA_ID=CAMNT_0011649303 /DNA_START=65 /DNA_END=5569 /DNA_ORIENTATION=+
MIQLRLLTGALSLLVVTAEPSDQCLVPDGVTSSSMIQQQQKVKKKLRVASAEERASEPQRGAASDARFLMQASFGPTRDGLAELSQMTYAQWITKQMQLPVYRQRVNPAPGALPQQTAKVDTPCTKGSRWHSFAFSQKDVGDSIFVNGTDAILVGGVFRTGIRPQPLASRWVGLAGFRGHICYVREGLGEDVMVAADVSCRRDRKYMPNPAIWRAPGSTLEVSAAYTTVKPGVVVLAESVPRCPLDQQPSGGGSVFVRSQGAVYRYEPRVRLADNVPASPTGDLPSCVLPSAVNEQSCRVWHIPNDNSAIPGLTVEVKYMSRRRRGKFVSEIDGPTVRLLVDEEVNHPETSSQWPGFPLEDYFAARWTGSLLVKTAGSYSFWLTSDDGSKLYIDSQVIVDNGGDHRMQERTGSAQLSAGSRDIVVDYFQVNSNSGIILEWQGPDSGDRREVVPSSALSTLSQGQVRSGCPVSCGSPGEVASKPAAGHHFSLYRTSDSDSVDNDYDSRYANRMSRTLSKSTVWTMKALEAQDQLRQRVAWAMSQIFVASTQGVGKDEFSEVWINYYDIFVRHAFGNFRDVMQEVTYSPIMGKYLTHSYSSSYDYNGRFPNENFAREIMQLFTLGLDTLNKDGTPQLDPSGQKIPTYTNEQIMILARVFTGFVNQRARSNIEYFSSTSNSIDPMALVARMHDIYPKPDLAGGFLGDGYPSCADPPPADSFLSKGAKYRYSMAPHPSDVLVLDTQSALLKALCGQGGSCGSAFSVTLPAALPCSGKECGAGPVHFVKAGDAIYEHLPPPCVHGFFHGATANQTAPKAPVAQTGFCKHSDGSRSRYVQLDKLEGDSPERQAECQAKCRKAGGVGCHMTVSSRRRSRHGCYAHLSTKLPLVGSGSSSYLCWDFKDSGLHGHSYALAKRGAQGCPAGTEIASIAECEQAHRSLGLSWSYIGLYYKSRHKAPRGCSHYPGKLYWSVKDESHAHKSLAPVCRAFITVDADGAYVPANVHSKFRVPWLNAAPAPGTHPVTARTQRIFGAVPSKAEAQARLSTGAHPPAGACDVCQGEVKAYYGGQQGVASAETVFEVDGRYYKNAESVLVFPDGRRAFRNPPVFLRSTSDAGAEAGAAAEAALDHLFRHGNTPVFFAKRMIQRFVTSNPSKSHVAAAADAFAAGAYDGVTYSGRYGDIAATIAAVLLHPDARTLKSGVATTIDGALREPMLKFMHLMRSMEYRDSDESPVVFEHLHEVIGQFPYNAPSVFNYYLADYELPMPKTRQPEPEPEPEPEPKTVYGPEFQIFTPPYMVGYLNGMSSLIKSGVSDSERCDSGKSLGTYVSIPEDGQWRQVCPQGSLTWPGAGTPNQTVHELDILLTGGRLTPVAKEAIRRAYEEAPPGRRLERAQQAAVMTAEFNTLGAPLPQPGVRAPSAGDGAATQQPYKAFIVLFLSGGADTWNMVVPQDCGLYQEYRDIRTDLALDPSELLSITTTGQTCGKFGIHARFRFLKGLYDAGEAAFVSNVGNLVEPTTKQSHKSGGRRCINLFSHSDQTTAAQTLKCQELGTSAKGTGGRVADVLAKSGFRTSSFSLSGTAIWPKGVHTRREIVDGRGKTTFHEYEQWADTIANITAQQHGNVYAEAYADAFLNNIQVTESLGMVLDGVQLLTNFPTDTSLKRDLSQVAKLIAAREGRKAERDFFFVSIGGWDMHSNMKPSLDTRFGLIDDALTGFVAEMKAQKIWDSVVLATESEFARTLNSNGGGSDHAWAGQHFMVGGALKGKRIFNKFPATLKAGNDRDLGRGRLIPEYPWESMLVPVAQWLGLKLGDWAHAFPNLALFNASHIIPRKELFKN